MRATQWAKHCMSCMHNVKQPPIPSFFGKDCVGISEVKHRTSKTVHSKNSNNGVYPNKVQLEYLPRPSLSWSCEPAEVCVSAWPSSVLALATFLLGKSPAQISSESQQPPLCIIMSPNISHKNHHMYLSIYPSIKHFLSRLWLQNLIEGMPTKKDLHFFKN